MPEDKPDYFRDFRRAISTAVLVLYILVLAPVTVIGWKWLRGEDKPDTSHPARLVPYGEVTTAWWAAQQLCLAYAIPDSAAERRHAAALIQILTGCPVPEVARAGRALSM